MKSSASAIVAVLLLLLGTATTHAQTIEPMTITFVRPGPEYHGVEAFIGTTLCGSADFDESLAVEVGGPAAPAPCQEPWRVIELVSLVEDHRHTLFVTPVFQPGTELTIQNFAPPPAVDGPEAHFGIDIYAQELSQAEREAIGGISAYVGGVRCGFTSLLDEETGQFWLPVGPYDGPAACRVDGAAIRLVQDDGSILRISPTVGVGPFYALRDFRTYPPGEGPAVPIPARAGGGVPVAPATAVLPLGLAALASAILGMARRGTRRTPTV